MHARAVQLSRFAAAWRSLAVSCVLIVLTACGGAGPKFSADVASALRDSPMRRLETTSMVIYYPDGHREQAVRFAGRAEACGDILRQRAALGRAPGGAKMIVVMPDVSFNNAYVQPAVAGLEPHSVVPTHFTFDFASQLGMPPDPGFIGCHEIAHYVQFQQESGPWRILNRVFGNLASPQLGLDAWFAEGLAVYIETSLQGSGRLAWPLWRGMFHAGVAGHRINGGDLSVFHRRFAGNHYLVGSHFVEYLAKTHGEDKLWRLIAEQGSSFFFLFAVNRRFSTVYGKSLSALIDDFADHVARTHPERQRPGTQRIVRQLGSSARYARAADGTEALISAGSDAPPRLVIIDPQGQTIRDRGLAGIVPPSDLVVGHPAAISGLSFTGDGETVYFVTIDQGSVEQEVRLCRYDIASDELDIVLDDLHGVGGSIDGPGQRYYYARTEGDHHDLAVIDLATGTTRTLVPMKPQTYVIAPRPSPDGARLVTGVFDGARFVLWVLDAASGERLAVIEPSAGHAFDASFVDGDRVIYVAEVAGRFQVFLHDLRSGAARSITDAPYLSFSPRAASSPRAGGATVRFLNRDGWAWTLDEVAIPAASAPLASAQDPVSQPPAGPSSAPGQSTGPKIGQNAGRSIDKTVEILSDDDYSSFDGLFRPQLHSISIAAAGAGSTLVGASLGGGDRLGFHSWNLSGFYQPSSGRVSGALAYVNHQLAPWLIQIGASQLSWDEVTSAEQIEPEDPYQRGDHRQRDGYLAVVRPIRTAAVGVIGQIGEHRFTDEMGGMTTERRIAGPGAFVAYQGVETTDYDLYRAFAARFDGAYFPATLGTLDDDFVDARGQLTIVAPLPLLRRHRLQLDLRGRGLFGVPEGSDFLQVGGSGAFALLYRGSDTPEAPTVAQPDALPPQTLFVEPLRGFEDLVLEVDHVVIGEASYRYPIMIDRGTATTLWLLPASFVRQLDLEIFTAAAAEDPTQLDLDDSSLHLAVGASVTLGLSFWLVPIGLRYQLARRLSDDDALVHSVLLGAGL